MAAELRSSQEQQVPGRRGGGKAPTLPRPRPRCRAQTTQSIHPSTPLQTGPPQTPTTYFLWPRAAHAQLHVPLRETWQQVPAPHRLILLPATGQGLTGINTSASLLATCLSIRGANLPAPRAAGSGTGRGAAVSRLASSPVGHRGPGREGAARAPAEPEPRCLLSTPCRALGVRAHSQPPSSQTTPPAAHHLRSVQHLRSAPLNLAAKTDLLVTARCELDAKRQINKLINESVN